MALGVRMGRNRCDGGFFKSSNGGDEEDDDPDMDIFVASFASSLVDVCTVLLHLEACLYVCFVSPSIGVGVCIAREFNDVEDLS